MKINWNPVENQKIFHTNTNINSLEIQKKLKEISMIYQWKSFGYPVGISMKFLWKPNGNPGEILQKFK